MRLEDATAVLVTTNPNYARAAFEYGKQFEETREVSSVITDFSLANIAWLKRPLQAPGLPQREIMAYSYAALNPRAGLWEKYLAEIEMLAKRKDISPNDHAALRYGIKARDELMNLTLGDEEALNKETISAILERTSSEWQQEKKAELFTEQELHQKTRHALDVQIRKQVQIEKRITRISNSIGMVVGVVIAIVLSIAVIFGTIYGIFIRALPGIIMSGSLIIFVVISVFNLVIGTTVKKVFNFMTYYLSSKVNDFITKYVIGSPIDEQLLGENEDNFPAPR